MSKKVDIWMPLYIADYISATSRLTTEQHGAYLLLMMDYWKNGAPPDNDQVLAQITKLSPDAWCNARTMLQGFFEVCDGHWYQHRIEVEMEKANHNKKANIERGKAGAAARWGNKDAPSIVEASSEVYSADSTSPSPSPSSLSLPLSLKKEKKSQRGSRLPEDFLLPKEWSEFCVKTRPELSAFNVWEEFRDYWIAQPGQKGVKTNWEATWRNWVRRQKAPIASISKSAQTNKTVMNGLTRGIVGGTSNVKLLGR